MDGVELPFAAVQAYSLVVLRIAAVLRFVPLLGGRPLGRTAWLALSAVLALVVVPFRPVSGGMASGAGWAYWSAALGEVAVGVVLGVAIRLAFSAFESAAAIVRSALLPLPLDIDAGAGRGPDVRLFFVLVAAVCFFSLSGHHALLQVIRASLECHPLGWASAGFSPLQSPVGPQGLWETLTLAVGAGLAVAAPVLTATILAEFFSGFLGRLVGRGGGVLPGQWLKISAAELALAATLWLGVKIGLELLMRTLDEIPTCV